MEGGSVYGCFFFSNRFYSIQNKIETSVSDWYLCRVSMKT